MFAKLPEEMRRAYERLIGKTLDKFLDAGHGTCVLKMPPIRKVLVDAMKHVHGKRVWTGDYVIMPNHVHVLMTPCDGFELEDILHSVKSFTANRINGLLNVSGPFWQRDSYDHIVRDREQLLAYQRYIAANPLKAKLELGTYLCQTAEYGEA